ncbi:hypothetical protein Tco_1217049 [Tanacetum coccineum]
MSKLLYTRFTKLIINDFLSNNKSIPRSSSSKLHSSQDDQPIIKLSNTIKGDYKFGIEIPDTMISDAIKKLAGYKFYMAKKVESENAKTVDEPEEQHVSPVKSGRGKGFMCLVVEDPAVQSLLDLRKGSKASRLESLSQKKQTVTGEGSSNAHNKHYADSDTNSDAILYSLCSEENENETDDADDSDMDLFDDNPNKDDVAGFGVIMYNKSAETPNSTYLSLAVTNSSLDFIQNLLNETLANELTNLVSNPVYTDAQTTSAIIYPEGNPKLTSYISGASEVPLVAMKFREYDQKLEALTNFNVSKAFEKAVQAKLKPLNRIHESKSNTTHPTNQKLYDTLYESVCLDHDALNAQDAEPSFYKRSHDNQDPPNNREEENMKKLQKDVGEPSFRSSWRNKSLVVHAQVYTPIIHVKT